MSTHKAKKFFTALNPQQKQFVENKTISATLSVKNWIDFLSNASLYDHYADQAIKRNLWGIVMFAVLTLVAIFLTPVAYYPLLIVIPVALGLITFYLIRRRITFKQRDINNYLRLFFMPFLEMLKVKAGAEAKLSASLDFRNPKKSITPVKTMVGNRNLKTYQPRYIIAKVTLLDGSYLEFVVTDEIRMFSYQNANGKFKSKTKTVHHYFIKLSLPKERYQRKELTLPDQVTVEETAEEHVFKLKGKEKANDYVLLKLGVFVAGLQSLFNLVDDKTTLSGALPPVPSSGLQPPDKNQVGSETPIADSSNVPFLLWSDSLFNTHDYYATRSSDNIPLITETDSKLSVFQS